MGLRVWRAVLLAWLVLCSGLAWAANEPAFRIDPVDDAWRAALPADPEAATRAYLARIPAESRASSDAYFEGEHWLELLGLAWTVAVAAALMLSGASRRLRDALRARLRKRIVQDLAYGLVYLVAVWLATLPLTIYIDFVREHAYGMATQSFGAWFGEQLLAAAISTAIGTLCIAFGLALIRRCGRSWWIWGAVAGTLLVAFMAMFAPVYISPLFNTYEPLAASPLQQRILSITRANGVPAEQVLRFDASRQTTRVSANVSGLFGTASIRLNDNLLNRCTEPEIVSVVAHEAGHYVLNHIPKMLVFFGLIIAVVFALTAGIGNALLRRHGARWGADSLGDAAALPMLVAVISLVSYLSSPVVNTVVRTQETEADLYALNAAREPDGFAEAILKLVEYRKAEPGPAEEWLFFDHPSAHTRILAAMRWKAETNRR